MEPNAQTAFIPKKPLAAPAVQQSHPIGIVSLICTIIFVTTLAIALVVFLFSYYLNRQNQSLDDKLQKINASFDQKQLGAIGRAANRIKIGKELLGSHLAPSLILDFVGRHAIVNIRFNSFAYALSNDGIPTISMNGQARSFAAVAAQIGEFSTPESRQVLQNPVISNVNLDKEGNVTFQFKSAINKEAVTYAAYVNANASAATDQTTGIDPMTQSVNAAPIAVPGDASSTKH